MPKDVAVVWYIDGQKTGEGEKFTVKEARESFTIQVKMVDSLLELGALYTGNFWMYEK